MGHSLPIKNQLVVDRKNATITADYNFDIKLENASEGLTPEYKKRLLQISKKNALSIAKYVESMKIEINLADSYRRTIIKLLTHFSRFFKNEKSFEQIEKTDILTFLDSFRKTEVADPLHR